MRSYPYSFDNGAGEVLTFTRRVTRNGVERVEGENVTSPGAGPPMHVHLWQEEVFTVLEGRIGYQRGSDQPAFAGPGETLVFPAGQPHRFWNDGDVPLRCAAYVEPPGNV
jgi:quercetin dioxygenase-like cupin family protein